MDSQDWYDAGSPTVDTKLTRDAVNLLNESEYAMHYGGLHIVVDDWNLQDDDINSCMKYELTDNERTVVSLLMDMTMVERYSTLKAHDDYLETRLP